MRPGRAGRFLDIIRTGSIAVPLLTNALMVGPGDYHIGGWSVGDTRFRVAMTLHFLFADS
jgi:hypothetical protein